MIDDEHRCDARSTAVTFERTGIWIMREKTDLSRLRCVLSELGCVAASDVDDEMLVRSICNGEYKQVEVASCRVCGSIVVLDRSTQNPIAVVPIYFVCSRCFQFYSKLATA